MNSLTLEEIKGFLSAELEKNSSLRDHFSIYFSGKSSEKRTVKEYKKKIRHLYDEEADRYGGIPYGTYVDFSYIRELADHYAEAGNSHESITIHQALSEAIAENMNNVDDSGGYYGEEFSQAIGDFVDCINDASMDFREKNWSTGRNYLSLTSLKI